MGKAAGREFRHPGGEYKTAKSKASKETMGCRVGLYNVV